MPSSRFTPEELDRLRAVAAAWGIIVSTRAFGDDGPGLDVDVRAVEQIAAAAQGLAEGALPLLLQHHAHKRTGEQPRPRCGTLRPAHPPTRPPAAQGAQVEPPERLAHGPDCRRDLFPPRAALGRDEHGDGSSAVECVVTATARFSSFRDATAAVRMAGIGTRERPVRRPAHAVGAALVGARDRKAVEHRRRQLPARVAVVPEAVAVGGGRIRTRAAERGPGVHDAQNKEGEVAALVTLTSSKFAPGPEPPASLVRPRRVTRRVAQMTGQAGEADPREGLDESAGAEVQRADVEGPERRPPTRLGRARVASPDASSSFGPMVAAGAQGRHFYEANRRALVAGGMAYNGTTPAGDVGGFEPTVGVRHVLRYVCASACAARADESGAWARHVVGLSACWQGRAGEVLSERDGRHIRPGEPPPREPQSAEDRRGPRRSVPEARSDSRNNPERMDGPRHRRAGRPTPSSLVESLVGEVNAG